MVAGALLLACERAGPDRSAARPASRGPRPALTAPSGPAFRPPARVAGERVVVPVTFVDGSSAEVVADRALGVQGMSAQVFTAGGLGAVDRTMSFRSGRGGAAFMHEGPLDAYAGAGDSVVELWRPHRGFPGRSPYLVYRFGGWSIGVRTGQPVLSRDERRAWARLLEGTVTPEGWLVLEARRPLVLQRAGGLGGPQLIFGDGPSNWIEIEPGRCDPQDLPRDGDARTMPDGTVVSFGRIADGAFERGDDWFVTWCEDGSATIQVSFAYEGFAEAAARGFRLREVVLAERGRG